MRRTVRKTRGAVLLGAIVPWLLFTATATMVGCGDEPNHSPGGTGGSDRPNTRPGGSGGDGGTGAVGGSGAAGGSGGSGGSTLRLRVDDIRPPRGSMLGGESVIINGAGFVIGLESGVRPDDVTEVHFGSNRAVGARVIDDDTILVKAPPGSEGDADILVKNPSGSAVCIGCFRYQAPVELSSIAPNEGSIHGGALLTLRGENLRQTMIVTVGSRAALDVRLQEDGSLVAILPPGDAPGAVDVRVFDGDGQAALRKSFQYVAPLRIERIDPPGGPLAGGNRIEIHGSGFTAAAQVFIGGALSTSTLGDDGVLGVVVPPAGMPGATELEVRVGGGSALAEYAYFDPAETGVRLYAVSPARGGLAGAVNVLLVGSNLDRGNLALRFGATFATATTVLDSNFVSATVPPAAAPGPVDLDLRVTGGGAVLRDGYRYVDTIAVHGVLPGNGPEAGGTTITITGAGFPVGARVFVGALEATGVQRIGPGELRAITPLGSDGPVPVRVVHPADPDNEGSLAAGFVYDGSFEVLQAEPSSGARAGGTRVVVRGSGFRPGMGGSFGSNLATSVQVIDPFTAALAAPRGEVGTVDLSVDSGAGDQVTLRGAFTYFDPANSYGGSSGGPLNGTLNITVLDGGRQPRRGVPLPDAFVMLGTDDGTSLQGLTDSRGQITFSDATLVKAQIVTVALQAYESTTVVNQASENLTVFLTPNFEPGQCSNGIDDDGDGLIDRADIDGCMCGPRNSPRPDLCMCPQNPVEAATCCDGIDNDGDGLIDSEDPDCVCSGGSSEGPLAQCNNCIDDDGDGRTDFNNPKFLPDPGCDGGGDNDERGVRVSGRVWGFKLPGGRTLKNTEREVAFVRRSVPSVFDAPPLDNPQPGILIQADGGAFAYEFASSRYMALYATYGILDADTNIFEPLLMGVRRNINPTPGHDITNADIILDMHLSLDVPVTIDNPPSWFGTPGASEVFAYMDLGLEGVIPVGQARTETAPGFTTVENLPVLSGESYVFQVWGGVSPVQQMPLTASFRRQAGDLSQGITMGPLLGLTRMLQPQNRFEGVIEWTVEAGPPVEIAVLSIAEATMTGLVPQWNIVLPGSERRVSVPPAVLELLREKYRDTGAQIVLTIVTGREPRFNYDQWNYSNLGLTAFTSFTYDVQLLQL